MSGRAEESSPSIRGALIILLLAVVSCESRNPAAIWGERSARPGVAAVATGADPSLSGEGDAGPTEPESQARRVLAGGTEIAPVTELSAGLRRIDLAQARRSGEVEVTTNDPALAEQLGLLFDGDTESLLRSEEINPLFVTFTFRAPVVLKGARVFPSYSSYDWAVQTGPDRDWLVVRDAAGEAWSAIELEQSVETGVFQLELLRRELDDFVHLNEVEIWIEPVA